LIDSPSAVSCSIAGSPADGGGVPSCGCDRRRGVGGEPRADLEAHPAVAPSGLLPHRSQAVARHLDVLDRERLEQGLALEARADQPGERLVVVVALGERHLEDGRIRRHAHHPLVVDQPVEGARNQQFPANEVEPHTLAQLEELHGTARHGRRSRI